MLPKKATVDLEMGGDWVSPYISIKLGPIITGYRYDRSKLYNKKHTCPHLDRSIQNNFSMLLILIPSTVSARFFKRLFSKF